MFKSHSCICMKPHWKMRLIFQCGERILLLGVLFLCLGVFVVEYEKKADEKFLITTIEGVVEGKYANAASLPEGINLKTFEVYNFRGIQYYRLNIQYENFYFIGEVNSRTNQNFIIRNISKEERTYYTSDRGIQLLIIGLVMVLIAIVILIKRQMYRKELYSNYKFTGVFSTTMSQEMIVRENCVQNLMKTYHY